MKALIYQSVLKPRNGLRVGSVGKDEWVLELAYCIILFLSLLFRTKCGKSPGDA